MTAERLQAWLDVEFGADGRCTRFTEWFVHHPKVKRAG